MKPDPTAPRKWTLHITRHGQHDVAVWKRHKTHGFRCAEATLGVKWMQGMENTVSAQQMLDSKGFSYAWLDNADSAPFKEKR